LDNSVLANKTVKLLASYLLNQRTHLLNMVKREGNRADQYWSSDYVEGQRIGEEKLITIKQITVKE